MLAFIGAYRVVSYKILSYEVNISKPIIPEMSVIKSIVDSQIPPFPVLIYFPSDVYNLIECKPSSL